MAAPRKAKPVTLTLRALNRATLARQMLLARERTTPLRALERLVALQAQSPKPPFIGLWSRVEGFRREALGRLLLARKAVRATTLRGTLHLMTAKDYRSLRAAVQPALTLGAVSILRGRAKDLDLEPLLKEARGFFTGESRTFEELRDVLARRHPKADVRAMAYLVRMHLPLVQASDETDWGYPAKSEFTLAESWLNQALAENVGPEPLVLRYLSACGPASASDMQTWSGLPAASVREAFAVLRPKLEAHHDERGRELFDLPKAPRPPEDAEVPVRFLPEFDHLLHSHADRRRFVADAHRRSVYLPALRQAATFLVDGFVAGTWKIERRREAATLVVEPFAPLTKRTRDELGSEGNALVQFVESDAGSVSVRFPKPPR